MKPIQYERGQKIKENSKLFYLEDTKTLKKGAKNYIRYALFECECGNVKEMDLNSIKHGGTISCGCHKSSKSTAMLEKLKEGILVAGKGTLDMTLSTHLERDIHSRWSAMLRRCYSKEMEEFYSDVTVNDDWLKFSNFFDWMSNQKYKPTYHLDKDVLWLAQEKGKIYSPEYCCLVPNYINNCLSASTKARRGLPVGVSLTTYKKNPYNSRIKNSGRGRHLGYFSTPEAAHQEWQKAKVEQLQSILNRYEDDEVGFIDNRVVDAMRFRINKIDSELRSELETTVI